MQRHHCVLLQLPYLKVSYIAIYMCIATFATSLSALWSYVIAHITVHFTPKKTCNGALQHNATVMRRCVFSTDRVFGDDAVLPHTRNMSKCIKASKRVVLKNADTANYSCDADNKIRHRQCEQL